MWNLLVESMWDRELYTQCRACGLLPVFFSQWFFWSPGCNEGSPISTAMTQLCLLFSPKDGTLCRHAHSSWLSLRSGLPLVCDCRCSRWSYSRGERPGGESCSALSISMATYCTDEVTILEILCHQLAVRIICEVILVHSKSILSAKVQIIEFFTTLPSFHSSQLGGT